MKNRFEITSDNFEPSNILQPGGVTDISMSFINRYILHCYRRFYLI
jgi:hypothetical protein